MATRDCFLKYVPEIQDQTNSDSVGIGLARLMSQCAADADSPDLAQIASELSTASNDSLIDALSNLTSQLEKKN